MSSKNKIKKYKAIKLRKKGLSYAQIDQQLGVSKSTLSGWLRNYPLTKERLRILRDINPQRIRSYQETMRRKKQARLDSVYKDVQKQIGSLSKREKIIAGLFLYWGEGLKVHDSTTSLANTDPSMILFFIKWMELLGVPRIKMKIKLHLYNDMDIDKETGYWSDLLHIPKDNFRKPYVKDSKLSDISYRNGFGHGTCNVIYGNRDVNDLVIISLKYIKEQLC